MTTITKAKAERLVAPTTATRTSDYPIRAEARAAVAATLERVDDLAIALDVRLRDAADSGERMELDDFIREQGYDPRRVRRRLIYSRRLQRAADAGASEGSRSATSRG